MVACCFAVEVAPAGGDAAELGFADPAGKAFAVCPRDWRAFFTPAAAQMLEGAPRVDPWVTSTTTGPSTSTTGPETSTTSTRTSTTTATRRRRPRLTTTTRSTTRTVTSTTTLLQPCSICPLYHFLCPDGCTNCVAAGECRAVYHKFKDFDPTCEARAAPGESDSCVDFAHVTLGCPEGNTAVVHEAVPQDGALPLLKCRICGLGDLPADGNPLKDRWTGRLTWGPNQWEGLVTEMAIEHYRVYIVNERWEKLGPPQLRLDARMWANLWNSSFCDTGMYKADLEVALPPGYAYFMVVPVTRAGLELNVGPLTGRIVDSGMLASGARRPGGDGSTALLRALSAALLVLGAALRGPSTARPG